MDRLLSVVEVGGQYVSHDGDIPLLMGVTACNDNRLRVVLHIYVHIEHPFRAFGVASVSVMIVDRVASTSSLSITAALENNPTRVITSYDIRSVRV